jgi:GntR family transcriptional regulator, transcriptional repressor for pyruvate dehydrogenase complex
MVVSGSRIQPVRRVNLTSQVMERVKEFILANHLQPGDRLPSEKELIVKLQVSRNILREALKSLEAVGLIEIKVGDGMYVSDFDYSSVVTHISYALSRNEQDLEHFIEARLIIEVGAMELVTDRITDDGIHRLEQCNARIDAAGSVEDAAQEDLQFHRELLGIAGNPILSEFGSFLAQFFLEARELVGYDAKFRTVSAHRDLMNALRQRDAGLLKDLMRKHILTWKGGE